MSIASQNNEGGMSPGGNGRREEFGQFQFNGTDATGTLKLQHISSRLDFLHIQPTGTVATDETVTPPAFTVGKGLLLDGTGTVTITRTGAAKTAGLVCTFHAKGY